MQFTVSSEQLKFFYLNGFLELEHLLSEQEAMQLQKAIQVVIEKSPGYPKKNFYRSIPLILSIARKRGWGQIASALIKQKSLRIESDQFFSSPPWLEDPLEEKTCALVIDLSNQRGIFCHNELPKTDLYNWDNNCYFLLILTAKRLPDRLNPILVR